ncbi:polysaccharide lyase family 7 protein [Gelidibacter maritimus]|uniref:Polysaccharide lyase family 7 protein n=1 Tax=Gelidibacter maritimus TaxID=2761487 RepID=A0A7W2M529_9FLAO|nr:polysaccharide lyase family 7 protein [Gelidibacter maritimus]MBA6152823.1 polysaccharide lyase family 7 protein [Gelidibacter maritimus]
MNKIRLFSLCMICFLSMQLKAQSSSVDDHQQTQVQKKKKKKKRFKLSGIDLSHWSVTVPAAREDGKPLSVEPPAILDYGNNEALKPYMYNDSIKGALVFYAYPSEATTANTKYSRSELREQMVPGDNNTNWTFSQGANMKGKLQMDEVTKAADGKYHKVIVMQIHGRLTNEQRDAIGQKDNNAPPMLKIYWQDGKIRVKTKVLKNLNAHGEDLLYTKAWGDDKGFTFEQEVGFKKFTLEVQVTDGRMVVILNNNEYKVYDDIHMRKWGIFENYFKAGNYFQSRDKDGSARVNYYELEVTH